MRLLIVMALLCVAAPSMTAQQRRVVTEKIEWTWSDRPEKAVEGLPNVLLIGDSITRAYYPAVSKRLEGVANCYLFATSVSVGDARMGPDLAEYLKRTPVRFSVVHLNNGMHGWGYTEEEYKRYFPEMLAALREGAAGAKLVWASTTPVRKDKEGSATNARIERRNQIAAALVGAEHIPMDDQHALMMGHQDLHADDVHYNPDGSAMQAEQVTVSVVKLLSAGK